MAKNESQDGLIEHIFQLFSLGCILLLAFDVKVEAWLVGMYFSLYKGEGRLKDGMLEASTNSDKK